MLFIYIYSITIFETVISIATCTNLRADFFLIIARLLILLKCFFINVATVYTCSHPLLARLSCDNRMRVHQEYMVSGTLEKCIKHAIKLFVAYHNSLISLTQRTSMPSTR